MNDDYILINSNFTELKPGGYIRYFNNIDGYKSGILVKNFNPILKLKSFNSNYTRYININDNKIYYKPHNAKRSLRDNINDFLNNIDNLYI